MADAAISAAVVAAIKEANKRGLSLTQEKFDRNCWDYITPPMIYKGWSERVPAHRGQILAWNSEAPIVAVLAGAQGGKTAFGPWWLLREIKRMGPGEYAAVSASFVLMFKKMQPEFMKVFKEYGDYIGSPVPRFEFNDRGLKRLFKRDDESCTVFFGHGANSESLESMTLKAVWLDECGQRAFARASWEAISRRVLVYQGRVLLTTTPYSWNWLKTDVYDAWVNGDTETEVINFRTEDNPSQDPKTVAKARAKLPTWRAAMMFDGLFTRPAGQIYDCFEPELNVVDRFKIPRHWKRFQGCDFGPVNTAAVWGAMDPLTEEVYLYRTYHAASEHAEVHAKEWASLDSQFFEPGTVKLKALVSVGGARSEDRWRAQYADAGYFIGRPAIADLETGITKTYGLIAKRKIKMFRDLEFLKQEITTYSREVNEDGEPLMAIADKAKYHRLDALRYLSTVIDYSDDIGQMSWSVHSEKKSSVPPGFEQWVAKEIDGDGLEVQTTHRKKRYGR